MMRKVPTGEARELDDAEAWRVLYECFGWSDQPTMPADLDWPQVEIDDDRTTAIRHAGGG